MSIHRLEQVGPGAVHAASNAARKTLSIIMPARNEERNLARAYDEVTAIMAQTAYDYEVVIIDNDSSDGTALVAADLCARDQRWRYLKFSRNFHVEASISAGLRYVRGDAAIVLFSDLQDPPELIPEFLKKWEQGHDVVYGVLNRRADGSKLRAILARLTYKLIHMMSDVEITPNATDFRLLSRKAINAMNQFGERNRFARGLAHWIGFKRCPLPYDRRPRLAGESKAPFWYCLNLAINAITCFSVRPLQLFSLCGMLALGGTLVLAGIHLACFMFALALPGMTTIYMLLLGNLAVMLLGFGTLGEYIGRIYVESKHRPLFIVENTINLDPPEVEPRSTLAAPHYIATRASENSSRMIELSRRES